MKYTPAVNPASVYKKLVESAGKFARPQLAGKTVVLEV
jgi:hypothetical protein